jgi:hypothetical protein
MGRAPRQLLRTDAHEPGAAAATHRLSGAPTADWVPRDEFRPHARESAETQRPPHRLRDVECHRPRQSTVAVAGQLDARAQPPDAEPSDTHPPGDQPSDAQPPRRPALRRSTSLLLPT